VAGPHQARLDRLPRRPSAAARRGVEVHRLIELHNRGQVPLEDFSENAYDVTHDEIPRSAARPFESFLDSPYAEHRPLLVEAPFDLRLDGATVRGRIDAIYEKERGHWDIVDFKSGRPSSNPALAVQLQAYAVAATEVPFTAGRPTTIDVTFAYLGDGFETVTERADPEWIDAARTHLRSLLREIEGANWEPAPSAACNHCDFSRFCEAGKRWIEDGD
jgi:RecB family exonuclease